MASSNERIIKAKQQFCAQFQFYSTGTSHEIQQSVNKLLKYKNCTESIEILSTLNYYLHCAHGSGNRYEDQRVCTRIRKKEPEKAVFYSLLEDVLLNTPPHKQLETPKWRRKVCYIFAGSVLPHICFTQSHQIAVKHTISLLLRAGWNVRDLYLLIKALAFVFQTEKQQDVFMEFLVRVQCRELTSDSVVSLGDSQHGEGRQLTVGDLIRSPCVNDYNALIMDGVDCITFIQNCMAASEFCKFIKRNQTVSSPGLTQKQYDQAITKLCESVSGLLVDRDCKTQAEIIATLNHYSQCEREDGSDAYADQRVCLKIKLKEPASFIFLCVLEDILRNSNNSDLNQSQNLSNDWRKAACRMFVESVLPNACTEQRRYSVVDMMNYFLSEQSWSAHDIYYLMKALTLVFKPEEATAYTFLLVLRSKELTPVSEIRYSDNRTLSVRDIILTNEIDYYRALINEPRDIQSAVDKIERLSNFDRTSCYTVIQKVACYVENIAEVKLLETFDAEFAALGSMQDDDVNVDNRDKTVKLLQVLCEAVRLSQGYTPRITQLVSVLVFLWKPTSDEARRCLIEIKSAEGKSCILAMTAAALALMGHKVDIVTSSPLLARRDSDNWQLFYRLLRISSGCNEEVKADDNFYLNKTVIYGTIRYFARDVLRTKFLLENVRDAERGFDVVLLDEADSMLLDQSRQCTYLSHDVACSGLNHLQPIFALIWLHLSKCTLYAINKDPTTVGLYYYAISPKIFYKYLCDENDVGFHFGTEQELIKQAAHILHPDIESMSFEERKRTITSISSGVVVSFIKSLTMHSVDVVIKVYRPDLLENTCCEANVNFVGAELIQRTTHRILVYDGGMVCPLLNTQELAAMLLEEIKSKIALSDDDVRRADKFVVPVFLRQYVQDRLPVWIASAMKARRMTKDKEYTVYVDKYIYPVDYLSTGVTEVNKRFGDGLQQFLELKHGLPLTPVPFLTNYLSNYGFLKLYANILGASATLGVDAEHAILKQCYDVEIVNDIPMHVAKLFYQIEGILRDTEEEWLNALYSRIAYWKICTDKRGAFLVLCEDIQTAENLYEYLLVANARYSFESWKVKLFCHGVRTVGSLGMNTLIECGDIFITTNLGSRGTDYQIDKELKDTYGLHVIIGFLPYNIRVQEQAFGRTSRQGAPGVGQLIVNKQKLPAELADCNTLEDALKMRDKLNRIRLETIGHIIKRLDIRDELFTVFCTILEEKVAEWDELGLSTEDKRIKRDSLNEIWAQWLETVMPALLTTSADEDIQSLKEHLDRVINDKLKLLSDNKCHNSNFYHVLNFASNAMSSRQYDLAMSYYDDIIKNYNEWSAFAHYNRAHCHMYLRRDEHCVEDALKDLESTKARLKANKTEAMYVMLPAELSTDSLANTFRKKFRIRCQILDYLDKTIAFGIDLLKNRCQDWSSTVYDDQLTSISSKDMKISYMCTDSDVTEILLELQEMGLRYVYKMNAFVVPISASNVESLCNLSCAITQIASFMQSLGIDAATLDPIAIASKCEAGCFSLVKDLSLACESWGVGEAIAQCFSTSDGSKRHDTDCISLAVQIVADTLGNGTDKSDEFDKTSGDCSLQLKLKNEDESIQNVFERALNVIRRIVTLRVRQALRNNQPLHDRLAALYVMCINQNQQNEWISVIDNLATKVNVLKWVKVENNILSHQQVSRKNDRQQSNLFNELVSGGQNQFYFSIAEDVVRLKQVVDSDGRVDIDTAVPLLTCTTIIADNTEVSVKNFLDQLAEDISQLYSKCDEMLWKNQVNALNYFERSAREDNAKDASKQELRIEPLFTRQTTDKTANILIEAIMADIDNNMRQAVVLVTSLKVLMHQLITNVTHPATSSVRPKRRLGRSAFDDGLFEVKTQSLVASHKLAFFLQYDVDSIDEDKWDLYRSYVASLNLNRTKQPESSNQPEPLTGGFPDVDVTLLTVVQPDGQHRIRHKHEYVIETSLKYDQHRENVRNFCEWARDFQQIKEPADPSRELVTTSGGTFYCKCKDPDCADFLTIPVDAVSRTSILQVDQQINLCQQQDEITSSNLIKYQLMAAKYYSVNDNACFNRHVRLVINLSGDPSLNLHTLDRNSFKVIHEFNSVDTGELLIEEVERFDPGNNAAVWSDKKIYYLVKDNRIEIYTKCFCGTYVYAAWDMLQRLFTYPVSAAMLGCAGVVSLGLGAYYALGACCFSKPFKLWAYVYYRQWKTHIDVEIFLSRDTVENKMLENNNLSFINYKWKRYEILSTKIRTAKYSYKIEYENSDKQKVPIEDSAIIDDEIGYLRFNEQKLQQEKTVRINIRFWVSDATNPDEKRPVSESLPLYDEVFDISVHPIFPVDEITAGSLSRIKTDLINSGVDIDTRYEKTWKEAINFLLSDKGGMCKHGVLYIKSDDDRDVIDFVCKHFSPNASGTVTVFLNNGTPERDIQKNLLTKLHQSKITGNLPNEIWEKRHAIMIATQAICACFPEQRQTLLPILKTLTAASNTNLDAEGARTVFETLEKAWKPSAQ